MPNCATPGRTSCSRAASGSGPLPNSPPAPLDPRPPTAMPCPPAPLPRRARRARKGSRALGAAAALAGAAAAATAVHTSQRPSQAFISPFEGARASAAASLVAGGLALGALQPPAIAENSFASLLGGAVTESLPQTDERLKTLQSQLKKPTLSPQKLEELERAEILDARKAEAERIPLARARAIFLRRGFGPLSGWKDDQRHTSE
ncbi:unnamed protein product [Prorocentrum cordatum]|uniref:PSI-F n=1 Tax=Prorocentrum cordatum TaxID=2364126 RepID=A0ABN9TJM1_9DINO|nr:unnamed protein product [Polarella glacialis]